MEEVYKTILEYPDYEISNLGNCRNKKTNRILKPQLMKNGYFQYYLSYDTEDGKRKQNHQYQHRIIAIYHIDNPFNKTDIDHIDNNPSNNNISNLRWVSKSENMRNQQKANNKTSIYKGVHFRKEKLKWCAKIEINKITKHIGYYNTEIEAGTARNKYIIDNNLGEFFKLNHIIYNN